MANHEVGKEQRSNLQAKLNIYRPESFFTAKELENIKNIINHSQVTELELAIAIRYSYKEILLALFSQISLDELTQIKCMPLWQIALARADVSYLDFLKKNCKLSLPQNKIYLADLALIALIHGSFEALLWLIKNSSVMEAISVEMFVDLSLEFGSPEIAQAIMLYFGHTHENSLKRIIEWIELRAKEYNLSLIDVLDSFFLSTDIKLIDTLAEALKKNSNEKKSLQKAQQLRRQWGYFTARYNSLALHAFQCHLYRIEIEKYAEHQKKFGLEAHNLVMQEVQNLLKSSASELKEVITRFSLWHARNAASRGDSRMKQASTLFREKNDINHFTSVGNAIGDSPYALALPYIEKIYLELCRKKFESVALLEGRIGYLILYQPKNSSELFPLTELFIDDENKEWVWHHKSDPKILWPILEGIHQKILLYKCNLKEKKNNKELQRLIALGFWLGIHTMVTARGNGLYMKMVMALWCNYHKIKLPLFSVYAAPLDTVALSLPLEKFLELNFFKSKKF